MVVKGQWAAWQLLDGWNEADHDICWAEMIAMELALLWIVSTRIRDVRVVVHGDNTGVQDALKKGQSRNIACNLSICWMTRVMALANIMLDPMYVTSETNLVDACSRSKLGTAEMCLPVLFVLPAALTRFISHV